MSATDTLRTAETLREAGVPDRQATAHARAIDEAVGEAVGDLVTREHLDLTLRAELGKLRDQLTWRLLGGIGVLLALLRLSEWLTR